MAKVPEKTSPPLKPKTTTSLGCFRYSKTKTLRSNDNDNNKIKIRRSWLCWSGFRLKKAVATKTVPLDISTVSEKQAEPNPHRPSAKLVGPEPKSKHVMFDNKTEVPPVTDIVEDPGVSIQSLIVYDKTPNSKQEPPEIASNTINLENRTQSSDASKDYACLKKRLSFCRKVDSIRTAAAGGAAAGSSQPGSPVQQENKSKLSSGSTPKTVITVISPAATPLLVTTPKRTRRGGAIPSSARKTWLVSNEKTMTTKRLDPLVGMTIIMVTLIIMVLWGRLCAILCTAAWFYLLPRLTQNGNFTTTTMSSSTAGNTFPHPRDDHLDFSSDEYKKRVVLEGFLERNNHRSHAHIL
ncbi:uncharacterized protein LOC126791418 [Argentina anserina]|uniref:uncharacterized protein LOC126791418 n=1 Tax=Argentina anserina TaxID=57926 RepID=UPI0021768154|nr:uncharacterized protein LOC126791418 [Potentilla anserina]